MAKVALAGVSKQYADGVRAVDELSLEVSDGEFMVLVGPSGCGKTTALRMVAGLEDVSEGVVRIGERVVNQVPSRDRDIAMVFQSYALYPHLSVYENIAFGLRVKRVRKDEIERRVKQAARMLDLEPFLTRKPRALSGGQRQRVAMGRAIVRQPQAFLMDEPLSNLDAKLRVQMRADIRKLQSDLGVTTIYVTHDQVEAMTMGDRIAVMRKGRLQQVDSAETLYHHPTNLFVAGFIGSPAMNVLEATVESAAGGRGLEVVIEDARLPLHPESLARHPALPAYAGQQVIVGIRPEDLEDGALAAGDAPRLRGLVLLREPLGSEVLVHCSISGRLAVTEDVRELAEDSGDDRAVRELDKELAASQATLVGRFAARSRVRGGERVEIAVDPRALRFFDPRTGRGIYGSSTPPPLEPETHGRAEKHLVETEQELDARVAPARSSST